MHEHPLTIREACEYYPVKTHRTTIVRHIVNGVRTPAGVVKLEARLVGKKWVTTKEAIDRFTDQLTANRNATPPRTVTRKEAIEKAESHLRSLGML